MSVASNLSTPGRLLGQPADKPVSARRFRQAAITVHTLDPSASWSWQAQPPVGDEVAVIGLVQSSVRMDWGADATDADFALFLHPHRELTVSSEEPVSVICVWVPWSAIEEAGADAPCAPVLGRTPLVVGLRGFVRSLIGRTSTPTIYTDYLVEKLLAEMAFGALLEAGYGDAAMARESAARQPRPVDRARTLMLLRRTDPSFKVEDLARELHMSTRQLQREFSAEGSSPAEELRRMRVEQARELFADPSYATLTVDEIAAHSGFGTSAALRRAFASLGMSMVRGHG